MYKLSCNNHSFQKDKSAKEVYIINVTSEIMVDTDYFFDVSFKKFWLVLEPSSVEGSSTSRNVLNETSKK